MENVTESDKEELDEEEDLTLTRDFEGISLDSETNTTANFTDQEGVSRIFLPNLRERLV